MVTRNLHGWIVVRTGCFARTGWVLVVLRYRFMQEPRYLWGYVVDIRCTEHNSIHCHWLFTAGVVIPFVVGFVAAECHSFASAARASDLSQPSHGRGVKIVDFLCFFSFSKNRVWLVVELAGVCALPSLRRKRCVRTSMQRRCATSTSILEVCALKKKLRIKILPGGKRSMTSMLLLLLLPLPPLLLLVQRMLQRGS